MLKRTGRSSRATARWMLAIWIAVVASSVMAPCKDAFALPRQANSTLAHAAAKAHEHARYGGPVAGEEPATPLDPSHCVESASPIPHKVKATFTPASAALAADVVAVGSPFSVSPSVRSPPAPELDVRPQLFLKTSRLLI